MNVREDLNIFLPRACVSLCIYCLPCACSSPCCPWQLMFFFFFLFFSHSKSRSYITFVWWRMQLRTFLPTSTAAESENKDLSKSPFWLCLFCFSLFLSLSFLCFLSYSTFTVPMTPPTLSWVRHLSIPPLFFSHLLHLSIFPSEEINAISPPCEKTNTDNPGRAAGMWPRISQPF